MGLVKAQMARDWERGWSAPDKYVCPKCVEDGYLRELITRNADECVCSYCHEVSDEPIAAPVDAILEAIASALHYFYAEPSAAGVPYENGWIFDPIHTADALMGIPFDAQPDLFEDVAGAFDNTAWVSASRGYWAAEPTSVEWRDAWDAFSDIVKHESRYFFVTPLPRSNEEDEDFEDWFANARINALRPSEILWKIGEKSSALGLLAVIEPGRKLYRVRERGVDSEWEVNSENLGPPPSGLAAAGRMNPAGIAYTYLGETPAVAIGEVFKGPPASVVVALFEVKRPLYVLDLTDLPEQPSVFDELQRERREIILFFSGFIESISRPIRKDGREHISYVPSQVVCEYFYQVFRGAEGKQLDGIVYPSAIHPPGRNIVLFPEDEFFDVKRRVEFICGRILEIRTWSDSVRALNLKSWDDVVSARGA